MLVGDSPCAAAHAAICAYQLGLHCASPPPLWSGFSVDSCWRFPTIPAAPNAENPCDSR